MADKNVEFDSTDNEVKTVPAQGASWSTPVEQKIINPPSGMLVLVILILLCLAVPVLFISGATAWRGGGIRVMLAILLCIVLPFLFGGLRSVRPNEALVLTLFGKYYGTIMKPGFFYVNPFARYNNPAYDAQAAAAATGENAADTSSRKSSKTGANRVKKTISLKRYKEIWRKKELFRIFTVKRYIRFAKTNSKTKGL